MKSAKIPLYSVVDLFAGAGGLSYGFFQSGRFEIKAAFENNHHAQSTYRRNHGNVTIYDDVSDALTTGIKKELGRVDVVIGGPPCQGFSNANRQKNHVINQNNSLVKKFVQAVLHLNPTAFVMENVSMLQSEVHRFYVDENDSETIKKYKITTTPAAIQLLDAKFFFNDAIDIISDIDTLTRYLWCEKDYLVLNIIYKTNNNKNKLAMTLKKHKNKLLALVEQFTNQQRGNDYVTKQNNTAWESIQEYYSTKHTHSNAEKLCKAIEIPIMLQRMFSKVKEIYDNNIIVKKYTQTTHNLVAEVTSMAVIDYIEAILGASYATTKGVLSAVTFGVPQKRMRFVVVGMKKGKIDNITLPIGGNTEEKRNTVKDAICDIENVEVTPDIKKGDNGIQLPAMPKDISILGKQLRNSRKLFNHVSTATTPNALERFKKIKQGENFHNLPKEFKSTYSDDTRTQNTIYLRLKYNEPSGTVVNARKSMWIHPTKDRAMSIREVARLQTFPDSFVFCGTKDSQYQQVGNAVPPILAKAIAEHLCKYLDDKKKMDNHSKEIRRYNRSRIRSKNTKFKKSVQKINSISRFGLRKKSKRYSLLKSDILGGRPDQWRQ